LGKERKGLVRGVGDKRREKNQRERIRVAVGAVVVVLWVEEEPSLKL